MADPAYLGIQKFMNDYDRYCTECNYAVQWMQAIKGKALALQADPNYAIALSVQERAAVQVNLDGASADPIKPVNPPVPIVPPTP